MSTRFAPLIVIFAPLFGQVTHQNHSKHMSAEHYLGVLDDASRDAWQKPHDVVMALNLHSTEVVADIGAGTGYFARRFAHHAGKVLAVDIEPKLLAVAAKNAPANLTTVLAMADDPKLQAGSVDTIFICDVLHHIDDRAAYLPKLVQALKPGGRIVIVDFHKRELPVGPPPTMKIAKEDVVAEMKAAGLRLVKDDEQLPHQYFLTFKR